MSGFSVLLWVMSLNSQGTSYATPAGNRPAVHRGNVTILPGGRVLNPLGFQMPTGPGTWGLAVSPAGRIVTANLGPERASLTYLEREKQGPWSIHNLVAARTDQHSEYSTDDRSDWFGVSRGIAFSGERNAWIAEGRSGKVRMVDLTTGARKHQIDLNQGGFSGSFTGDLAFDAERSILFVTDQANARIGVIDAKHGRLIGSVKSGPFPFALALSEDRKFLYETNLGNGDSYANEANTLGIVNVEDPTNPKAGLFVPTGLTASGQNPGGSGPSRVVAGGGRIFVSNALADSITVLDAKTHAVVREINLRIPGLDVFRGIMPLGMAFDAGTNTLYAAAAGINALAVIDISEKKVSYIPTDWFPTQVIARDGSLFVSCAKGHGTGSNVFSRNFFENDGLFDTLRRGSVTTFPVPDAADLRKLTQTVLTANGFIPFSNPEPPIPKEVTHVVLIVKDNRGFDEIFGDVSGTPSLARFGETTGYAGGDRKRFSLQRINVTPNHHAIAKQWAMSDNFYADSESSVEGLQWLAGNYPDPQTKDSFMAGYATAAPTMDSLWAHFRNSKITFREFGANLGTIGDPTDTPDQTRADRFIQQMEESYAKPGKPVPRFILIRLPNDRMAKTRPQDGYSYGSSFVADNDYAMGRIVEYLSKSPWWRNMAIFVTETSAEGARDHIDSHRTLLLAAGPYIKKAYVLHANSSFPGLLKTIFRILGTGPLNLYDACATDLSGVFTSQPDFTPYILQSEDPRLFEPSAARAASHDLPN